MNQVLLCAPKEPVSGQFVAVKDVGQNFKQVDIGKSLHSTVSPMGLFMVKQSAALVRALT